MHDHRMVRRAPLGGVEFADGRRVAGVGPEAVDGFGGKSDEAAALQYGNRLVELAVHCRTAGVKTRSAQARVSSSANAALRGTWQSCSRARRRAAWAPDAFCPKAAFRASCARSACRTTAG